MAATEQSSLTGGPQQLAGIQDLEVRHGFIRKVYGILGVQMTITTIIASLITIYGANLVKYNPALVTSLMVVSMVMAISTMCVFMCCPDTMRKTPTNYMLLLCFTVAESVMVGFICVQYTVQSVLVTLGITAALVLALSLFALQTSYDFTGFMPYLFALVSCLFLFGLVMSIFSWCGALSSGAFQVLNMIYAGLGAIVFSFYVIFDTQLIVGGKHNKFRFSIDDYCMAAINIYVDIIQLFLFLLQLLGERLCFRTEAVRIPVLSLTSLTWLECMARFCPRRLLDRFAMAGRSNKSCESFQRRSSSVPPSLWQALASVTQEVGEPPSEPKKPQLSQAHRALVRPHGAQEEPRGRYRQVVPQRMLLPLPGDYFKQIAGPEKLVLLSWTTGAPADPSEKGSRTDIAVNLALSIRKHAPHLEKKFVYISMDTVAHKVMQEYGFNSVLCEAGPCRSRDLKDDIWKMRWYLMLTLTSFGLRVLVVDADIVFLGDPTKEFFGDADMEVMTDHFFPGKHLWEPWVRVEDHINTGFVLVKPTRPMRFLLADFLDENWQSEQGGVRRDGMDQRVFNHFIVRRMGADIPLVVGRYDDKVFGRPQTIVPAWPWRQASIRVLDPARVAHGMNFFWRRAHLLDPEIGSFPAVAHVNGADPKEYFLRDRQVWFLDDWHDRLNASVRFLTYDHPGGQSLQGDFSTLSAAVEVAKLLGRRLVLPNTMNCRNAPSYYAWGLNVTVQKETESGNCTFDYFSWAKNLLDAHLGFVIESGVRRTAEFLQLVEADKRFINTSDQRFIQALLSNDCCVQAWPPLRREGPVAAQWLQQLLPEPAAVVHVATDILQEWDSMTCIFQQFPHQVNVCRDDRYVSRFGKGMSFWGYSEKLEIFTGARWDRMSTACKDRNTRQRLRIQSIAVLVASANRLEPNLQEHCMLVPEQQPMTIYGDSHFYSPFKGFIAVQAKIIQHRMWYHHRLLELFWTLTPTEHHPRDCNTFLLWRGRYDRAFKWLGTRAVQVMVAAVISGPLSWDTGRPSSSVAEAWHTAIISLRFMLPYASQCLPGGQGDIGSEWKLRHDVEQFRYLSRRQLPDYYRSSSGVLEQSSALLEMLCTASAISAQANASLASELAQLKPYLDRAVHVPHLEKLEGGVLSTSANWLLLEETFRKDGLAYLDAALLPKPLAALVQHFLEATVWYSPQAGGSYLKATLFDGLHAELLLQMAAELPALLPTALGPHRLSNLYAHKYDTEWPGYPGLGTHSLPCSVAVAVWTTPDAANLDKKGGGFEVFHASAEEGMSATERYAWMPQLEEDLPKHKLIQQKQFASTRIAYKSNRLVMWRCDRLFRTDWSPMQWRGGLRHRRADLWLLFGNRP
ncbi:TMBIM1 [Symbiodinium natans]|uniref:TMBIM1 protein n=1 Tax=Symbiodinium natans TaxID=878477 RepID=A0A812I5Q2_9DINO|nr:TMBIM1 [Symbiodinium natans]